MEGSPFLSFYCFLTLVCDLNRYPRKGVMMLRSSHFIRHLCNSLRGTSKEELCAKIKEKKTIFSDYSGIT